MGLGYVAEVGLAGQLCQPQGGVRDSLREASWPSGQGPSDQGHCCGRPSPARLPQEAGPRLVFLWAAPALLRARSSEALPLQAAGAEGRPLPLHPGRGQKQKSCPMLLVR